MNPITFQNYGGNYQLKIETPEELRQVLQLDEPHWAATSAPVSGIHCDPEFLEYLDSDRNGRIRTDEVKTAVAWLFRMLANPERLAEKPDALRLDDIDQTHADGQTLLAAAKRILTNLGVPDAEEIAITQVRDLKSIMANAANNGDGVVPPDADDNEETRQFIQAVMDCVGSVPDASGQLGIDRELIDSFIEESKHYLEWEARGQIPEDGEATEIQPWAEATAAAWQTILEMDEKIIETFAQCDLVRFDSRARDKMKLSAAELQDFQFPDRGAVEDRLRQAPLAPPNPEGVLDLDGDVNPYYEPALARLRTLVLNRTLRGSTSRLTRGQWRDVKKTFEAHAAWLGEKKGDRVEKLGCEKITAFLQGPHEKKIREKIANDEAVARELEQIQNVEKLILCQKWMMAFANSFVSFPCLYDPKRRSLFEMGTLLVDGRELTFCVRVQDRAAHKTQAAHSNMCVLYAEITGKKEKEKEEKFEIVAAVTSGDSDGLGVGKRGVFFTVDGREWDALVVDVIENPVSLSEAVKAPFEKIGGFFSKQIEKFSKVQQTKAEAAVASPQSSSAARDLLLAGSVGVAALGSSFAYITKAMLQVEPFHVLVVLLGMVAVLVGPGLVMGYFKLRKRDLTSLLEASGWAVNIRMRLTWRLGSLFTIRPPIPKTTIIERRDLVSRFVEELGVQSISWKRIGVAVAVGAVVELILIWIFKGIY